MWIAIGALILFAVVFVGAKLIDWRDKRHDYFNEG